MFESLGVLIGDDGISEDESFAEVGSLAFVPSGSRVVPKESREAANWPQFDETTGVEEDKGHVVDDSQVHSLAI